MADTSGTMACTIAVKLHRRNLEQVKETPEPRGEDRSLQWARVHREIEAEREGGREREITCTHVRRRYRPPSASSVLELFSYFHVKRLFGLGHRGLLPGAWTGPVIKFISMPEQPDNCFPRFSFDESLTRDERFIFFVSRINRNWKGISKVENNQQIIHLFESAR